jgi:hypothetical protein
MTTEEYIAYMARVAATPGGVGMTKALCDVLTQPAQQPPAPPPKPETWRDRPPLL